MKKMGRAHRHFFRICAIDKRTPRDGRVLEELGTYDPMITEADARVVLKNDRVDHWLSVGALPSEKCAVLIKKYGSQGTHLDAQKAAFEKLAMPVELPEVGPPAEAPKPAEEPAAEEQSAEAPAAEEAGAAEAPAEEAKSE
ncbi:30S ribosomal protein S16 [Botrimarina hoheduenensis]|nr:30S ribosomal protein S16 [Botrimarina hoheduenensis]